MYGKIISQQKSNTQRIKIEMNYVIDNSHRNEWWKMTSNFDFVFLLGLGACLVYLSFFVLALLSGWPIRRALHTLVLQHLLLQRQEIPWFTISQKLLFVTHKTSQVYAIFMLDYDYPCNICGVTESVIHRLMKMIL